MIGRICRYGIFALCILLTLSLFAGCADTGDGQVNTKPESLTSNDKATDFTSLPETGRGYLTSMLPADGNWREDPHSEEIITSLTYTGDAVSFVYLLESEGEPGGEQLSIRLYVDGVPQPFTMGEADGVPACDQPVEEYFFDASRDRLYCLPISFVPVRGYAGESLPLYIVFTPSPNYKVTHIRECRQGGWMKSVSPISYLLQMQADAPEQRTVDTHLIDIGVTPEGEDGTFVTAQGIASHSRESVVEGVDLEEREQALREAGFGNDYTVYVMKPEPNGMLNVMLQGTTSCTPLYRLQLRINGKAVPVFEGKYYADVRFPNTNMVNTTLLSLDVDLSAYSNARTVQWLLIPLPETGFDWREASLHMNRIVSTKVAWIRYEGDEE